MSYQQCTKFQTTLDLIVNISGTDQAINKWKTALSTTIFPTFYKKKQFDELRSTNEKMTVTFDL